MANWYGTARSNYVRVKDEEGLETALEGFDIETWKKDFHGDVYWAFGGGQDSGGFPSWTSDDEGNDIEFDWKVHVMPYLEDDQTLIVMEVGAEKMRYVTGWASAFRMTDGKVEEIYLNLDDIYTLAKVTWGEEPGVAQY